jgi:aminopeptidase-like protein/aminoglycoside N3'-acetyltransferase
MAKFHYTQAEMIDALRAVGLKQGDVVFSHANVGFFGFPDAGHTAEAIFETIFGAFRAVIGEAGTLVVPTFTYSFAKNQPYNADESPSSMGIFAEMLRQLPEARRSWDPMFSVAAVGARAEELTADVPVECFGSGSFWDRFFKANGVICNLNFDAGSTFIHYVERCLDVPYRYDKFFPGVFEQNGETRRGCAIYFCQDLSNPDTVAAFEPFDALARERGVLRTAKAGRGAVVALTAADTYRLIEDALPQRPYLLTKADAKEIEPALVQPNVLPDVRIPEDASMFEMIEAVWALPRDLVSDGYDAALRALATQVPMTIHEYPTGTHSWTWVVPEKWTCHEAYLETLDGRRIFSYEDNPLHVASYSQPFEGEVSREELFTRLKVHPVLPNAIPFSYLYYKRDWGLACSQETKDTLTDEAYRVVIRSSFSYGTLKVGEVVVPGQSDECIVLCGHLCHPMQVNDGLSGVVVGIDVMRELARRDDLHYTYRLVILPETIGSASYLSHNEALIPKMKAGLFLEMMGLDNSFALQLSFKGDTTYDRLAMAALQEIDPAARTGKFFNVVMNDERQFNAPGVQVPMLSLSRLENTVVEGYLFAAYHSHLDSPELAPPVRLRESKAAALKIIDFWEANRTPVNRFKGEVFLSRYGITYDFLGDTLDSIALFNVMFMLNGEHSILEIAERCNITFSQARRIVEMFHRRGLVEMRC